MGNFHTKRLHGGGDTPANSPTDSDDYDPERYDRYNPDRYNPDGYSPTSRRSRSRSREKRNYTHTHRDRRQEAGHRGERERSFDRKEKQHTRGGEYKSGKRERSRSPKSGKGRRSEKDSYFPRDQRYPSTNDRHGGNDSYFQRSARGGSGGGSSRREASLERGSTRKSWEEASPRREASLDRGSARKTWETKSSKREASLERGSARNSWGEGSLRRESSGGGGSGGGASSYGRRGGRGEASSYGREGGSGGGGEASSYGRTGGSGGGASNYGRERRGWGGGGGKANKVASSSYDLENHAFVKVPTLEELRKVVQKPSGGATTYIACASRCGAAQEIIKCVEEELRNVYKDDARVIVSIKVHTHVKTEKHVDLEKYKVFEKFRKEALVSQNALVAVKNGDVVYTTTRTKEVVVKPVENSSLCFVMRSTVLEPLGPINPEAGLSTETRAACAFSSRNVVSCISSKMPLEFTQAALDAYQSSIKGETSTFSFMEPSGQVSQETLIAKPGTRFVWCQPESLNAFYFVPSMIVSPTHVSGDLCNVLMKYKAVVLLTDLEVCALPANTKRAVITPLAPKGNGYKNRGTMFQVVLEDQSGSDVFICTGFPGTSRPKKVDLLDNILKLENLNFRD